LKIFSFPKTQKLCSNAKIEALFASGDAFLVYPYRVVYKIFPLAESPVQFAFGVKKKSFKRANKRNRIKRMMREAYRLHKQPLFSLFESRNETLAVFVSFVGKEELDYSLMSSKMIKLIEVLIEKSETESMNSIKKE
jgi:ribonuclease P protein component